MDMNRVQEPPCEARLDCSGKVQQAHDVNVEPFVEMLKLLQNPLRVFLLHDWIAQRQYERRAYEIVELERLRVDSDDCVPHRPQAGHRKLAAAKEPHPSKQVHVRLYTLHDHVLGKVRVLQVNDFSLYS